MRAFEDIEEDTTMAIRRTRREDKEAWKEKKALERLDKPKYRLRLSWAELLLLLGLAVAIGYVIGHFAVWVAWMPL